MTKFIPRPKLSKKARKELDAQKRTTWAFSPVTKKVESKKIYNRKKAAHVWKDDSSMSGFAALGMVPRRTPPVAAFESCNGLAGFFVCSEEQTSQQSSRKRGNNVECDDSSFPKSGR